MTYSINKNYIFGSIVLGLALVFVVGLSQAPRAEACNSGCGTYYPPTYNTPPQPSASPLYVQCYPQPLTANVGDSATWVSNISGGNGSFSYSWSGTDGLVGAGPSIAKVYYTSGSKSATLTVTSGSQTKSVSCSGTVTVYGNTNTYDYPPVYQPPVYVPPTYYPPTYYSPLQITCTPNITYTNVGTTVTWSANVYGGSNNGYYGMTYSWSGTDGLYGNGQSISTTYNNPGYKTATVTVYSNGQTATQACSNSVNVTGYNYNYQSTYYNYNNAYGSNNSGLNIGCYSDPQTASVNQPITWSVEVTGGVGPYTYSWSGTDGLSGSAISVVKYYNSRGEKSAIVSVTSADGKTGTHACSNTLNVRSPGGAVTKPVTPAPTQTAPANDQNNGQSAAALFSLQSIPWGWVAILIILVLFATIMYLIFNRPKI
ncbi:MAG: hypothetical protein V4524_00265 [Patescibacteria group bacterium]